MAEAASIGESIGRLVRNDGGRLLANLISNLRDFQLAQDSLQDALESALHHWARNGLPDEPSAWLMRTARRKAIDRIRRAARFRSKSAELAALIELDSEPGPEPDLIPDERLGLIFTCCHPALDRRTSVALTLRSICGLTTEEIARAFVVTPDAMAQRLVRARHKITKAGIAYEVPGPEAWGERLDAVLGAIYLTFNEGYAASSDALLRPDLCEEAIRLCRVLLALRPDEPETEGLLALMLLHHARSPTRLDAGGVVVALEAQDRRRWDRARIAEGAALVETALRRFRPGPYQMQAAIAALHAEAPSFAETGWHEIALLYAGLFALQQNPVFELNRLVALSYVAGPEASLAELDGIAAPLAAYQPYHAVRADFLARSGRATEAEAAYDEAIRLAGTEAEQHFLRRKRGEAREQE